MAFLERRTDHFPFHLEHTLVSQLLPDLMCCCCFISLETSTCHFVMAFLNGIYYVKRSFTLRVMMLTVTQLSSYKEMLRHLHVCFSYVQPHSFSHQPKNIWDVRYSIVVFKQSKNYDSALTFQSHVLSCFFKLLDNKSPRLPRKKKKKLKKSRVSNYHYIVKNFIFVVYKYWIFYYLDHFIFPLFIVINVLAVNMHLLITVREVYLCSVFNKWSFVLCSWAL